MAFSFVDTFIQQYNTARQRVTDERARQEQLAIRREQLRIEQERLRIARAAEARLLASQEQAGRLNALRIREAERKESSATLPIQSGELEFARDLGINPEGLDREAFQNLINDKLSLIELDVREQFARNQAPRDHESDSRIFTPTELSGEIFELQRLLDEGIVNEDGETKKPTVAQAIALRKQITALKSMKSFSQENLDKYIQLRNAPAAPDSTSTVPAVEGTEPTPDSDGTTRSRVSTSDVFGGRTERVQERSKKLTNKKQDKPDSGSGIQRNDGEKKDPFSIFNN